MKYTLVTNLSLLTEGYSLLPPVSTTLPETFDDFVVFSSVLKYRLLL